MVTRSPRRTHTRLLAVRSGEQVSGSRWQHQVSGQQQEEVAAVPGHVCVLAVAPSSSQEAPTVARIGMRPNSMPCILSSQYADSQIIKKGDDVLCITRSSSSSSAPTTGQRLEEPRHHPEAGVTRRHQGGTHQHPPRRLPAGRPLQAPHCGPTQRRHQQPPGDIG